jgi:hypothetical protein
VKLVIEGKAKAARSCEAGIFWVHNALLVSVSA